VSKNLKILIGVLLALVLATPAMAATFTVNGDMNTRFLLYTDQLGFFGGDSGAQVLDKEDRPDSGAEIKYRMWVNASTNDGKVYGVFGFEVGSLRFGSAALGGSFGGDGKGTAGNIETMWFYTDFQLPSVASTARFRLGLQPQMVNPYFWVENAMGVKFYTDNFYLSWFRGLDANTGSGGDWGDGDLDSINARYDLKMEPVKVGLFASYVWEGKKTAATAFTNLSTFDALTSYVVKKLPTPLEFNLLAVGIDGGWSAPTGFGKVFINWDAIYEFGKIKDVSLDNTLAGKTDLDLKGYLLHADIGANFGAATLTFTSQYASGDKNPDDKDLKAYMAVDTDRTDSAIFQEGHFTDDTYFTDRPYIHDWGLWLNKLALNYQATKQTNFGVAVLYLQTAVDVQLTSSKKSKKLGTEIDAYVKHKLYDNLEVGLDFAYLASGDVMDEFETGTSSEVGNGSGDVDVFLSSASIRYKF